jgi:DNA-binding IclR family transcriptional regulator
MVKQRRRGGDKPYSSAVAVERAVDILFLIAERGEVSLTDLARAIGSSGSAVHRILTALKKKGLIEQPVENGLYSLSWSILALTQRLASESDLRGFALPFMIQLRELSGETVTINARSGFARVCIDQVEGPHEVTWRQEIGRISPLYAGATGKMILANLPEPELESYLDTVERKQLTPYTTVDRGKLEGQLAEIRARGYAISSQDRVFGVAGISAPIFDRQGSIVGALTIAGPAERCSEDKLQGLIDPLTSAATQLSRLLGLQPTRAEEGPSARGDGAAADPLRALGEARSGSQPGPIASG